MVRLRILKNKSNFVLGKKKNETQAKIHFLKNLPRFFNRLTAPIYYSPSKLF